MPSNQKYINLTFFVAVVPFLRSFTLLLNWSDLFFIQSLSHKIQNTNLETSSSDVKVCQPTWKEAQLLSSFVTWRCSTATLALRLASPTAAMCFLQQQNKNKKSWRHYSEHFKGVYMCSCLHRDCWALFNVTFTHRSTHLLMSFCLVLNKDNK